MVLLRTNRVAFETRDDLGAHDGRGEAVHLGEPVMEAARVIRGSAHPRRPALLARATFSCAAVRSRPNKEPPHRPRFEGLRGGCNEWRRRELNPRPRSRKGRRLRAYPV